MYKEVSKIARKQCARADCDGRADFFLVMTVSNNFIYPHNKNACGHREYAVFSDFSVYFLCVFRSPLLNIKSKNNTFNVARLGNKNNPQLLMSVTMLDIKNFGKYDREKAKGTSVLKYCGEIRRSNRCSFNVTINEKNTIQLFFSLPKTLIKKCLMR
ncbi:MAG: hypothetical protein L6V93_10315 [Clostridiales bacterium]|nr:MAG: hypothetical protein L6V93_10315 [Clostridiales bacterium]